MFAGGVRANVAAALSFGFAEPTADGDRCLLGVACKIGTDFLEQVKQRVAELDEAHHIDFSFMMASVSQSIDSSGFEKYQTDDGHAWLVDDLKNRIIVRIMQNNGPC
ncbi:hypothetical protein AAVH_28419 [Aphelenchoides avenae]|nr:hypothetical protein AAVH_28419 [Aphelenchus avenae]